MSYAPGILLDLRTVFVRLGAPANGVGIVGDGAHQGGYHLGADRLMQHKGWADYSAKRGRDVAALKGATRNAACALDVSARLPRHRDWLWRLLADFKAGAPYTRDLRAINGTLDGKKALRWDREHHFAPVATDPSHLWHTHLEWYRDTVAAARPQLAIANTFYGGGVLAAKPGRALTRKAPGAALLSIKTLAAGPGARWTWAQLVRQFYAGAPASGPALAAAGAALRAANADRPPRSDGSATWETVGQGVPVTVPRSLGY